MEKNKYISVLNEQFEVFNKKVSVFKEQIESMNFQNNEEVKKKYGKLEKSMERFSWKIRHLQETNNIDDDLVKESFNDIIDEISLRLEEVELALKGRQLWEAGEDINRNKWKIKNLQT